MKYAVSKHKLLFIFLTGLIKACTKTRLGKLRPASHVRPATVFHVAHKII